MIIKTSNLLYKIVLILLTLDSAISNTSISDSFKDPFHHYCLFIVLIVGGLILISRNYTKRFLCLNIIIILFAIISYKISGNSDIFTSILLIMLAWQMDLDEILKMIFKIRITVFVFIILLSLIGILDIGAIATSSEDKGVLLGYGHANVFAGTVGILIFLLFAINRNKIKNIDYIIAILADIATFYLSKSRTGLLCISLVIILTFATKMSIKFNYIILKLSKYILPFIFIFVFSLVGIRIAGVAPKFIDIMDKTMNGRILLACMNLKYYPITLLGQEVDVSLIASHNRYYALDNGYVYILIHYGIIGLMVILGLQQWAIMHCRKLDESVLCVISMMVLCWMMYEGMMVSATTNFTLLFSVTLISKMYSINQEEKCNDT